MVVWPHVLGKKIMVAGVCDGDVPSPYGRQEAERERKGTETISITFKGTPLVTQFLQLSPTSPKVSTTSQNAPPAGDQVFNTCASGARFINLIMTLVIFPSLPSHI
jgi:hypothetical protein